MDEAVWVLLMLGSCLALAFVVVGFWQWILGSRIGTPQWWARARKKAAKIVPTAASWGDDAPTSLPSLVSVEEIVAADLSELRGDARNPGHYEASWHSRLWQQERPGLRIYRAEWREPTPNAPVGPGSVGIIGAGAQPPTFFRLRVEAVDPAPDTVREVGKPSPPRWMVTRVTREPNQPTKIESIKTPAASITEALQRLYGVES